MKAVLLLIAIPLSLCCDTEGDCNSCNTYCTTCASGYVMYGDNAGCVMTCDKRSDPACTTCKTDSTECTACTTNTHYLSNGGCGACAGPVIFSETHQGLQLTSNCDSCSDEGSCGTCASGYHSTTGRYCLLDCDATVAGLHCETCTDKKCTACSTGFHLVDDVCIHDCVTTADDVWNKCTACNADATACETCADGYTLEDSVCIKDCVASEDGCTTCSGKVCGTCTAANTEPSTLSGNAWQWSYNVIPLVTNRIFVSRTRTLGWVCVGTTAGIPATTGVNCDATLDPTCTECSAADDLKCAGCDAGLYLTEDRTCSDTVGSGAGAVILSSFALLAAFAAFFLGRQ